MTDYGKFRKTPDQLSWMRTPQAQHFTKQLSEQLEAAHKNLLATCEKSSDPKVTAACARWHELDGLVRFLANARESATSD